jgi:hypothetical protein
LKAHRAEVEASAQPDDDGRPCPKTRRARDEMKQFVYIKPVVGDVLDVGKLAAP